MLLVGMVNKVWNIHVLFQEFLSPDVLCRLDDQNTVEECETYKPAASSAEEAAQV